MPKPPKLVERTALLHTAIKLFDRLLPPTYKQRPCAGGLARRPVHPALWVSTANVRCFLVLV